MTPRPLQDAGYSETRNLKKIIAIAAQYPEKHKNKN
jgi:hypothetical protein